MQCLNCGFSISIDDRFCEECGTSTSTDQPISPGCEKCGAEIGEIDPEGYCLKCGFRQSSLERDRLEVLINSHLAGVSDRGLRHRHNEDFLALQQIDSINRQIIVVCDGVSSSAQADIASRIAAESTCQYLNTAIETADPSLLIRSAVAHALASVCDIPTKAGIHSDYPSTTIVTAIVQNGLLTVGWLGDSRAYWIGEYNSQQLTRDHSWLDEVVAAGEMSVEEAEKSSNAHAITRWLGADAQTDAIPTIVDFDIPGSGYILLCTDGLWNYAPEAESLANLVRKESGKDAITIARSLVDFARDRGGHDNITVGVFVV